MATALGGIRKHRLLTRLLVAQRSPVVHRGWAYSTRFELEPDRARRIDVTVPRPLDSRTILVGLPPHARSHRGRRRCNVLRVQYVDRWPDGARPRPIASGLCTDAFHFPDADALLRAAVAITGDGAGGAGYPPGDLRCAIRVHHVCRRRSLCAVALAVIQLAHAGSRRSRVRIRSTFLARVQSLLAPAIDVQSARTAIRIFATRVVRGPIFVRKPGPRYGDVFPILPPRDRNRSL